VLRKIFIIYMSGLTGYLTQYGIDLSYIFHPKNSITEKTSNTYSGTNTFSGKIIFSELQLSYGTISSNITLSSPILNFYHITSGATTITLSVPNSNVDTGTFIIFKHTNTGNIIFSCSGSSIVAPGGTSGTTSVTLTNARVAMVTCNGSAWWIYNFTT